MNAVEIAKSDLEDARRELGEVLDDLAESESAAWSAWVDAQAREFIRTQPTVFAGLDDERKRTLKELIEKRQGEQRSVIVADVLKLKTANTKDLMSLADPHKWQKSMESYATPIGKVLRSNGFEFNTSWGSGWLERPASGESPALRDAHSNAADRGRFSKAVQRLKRAEDDLEVAEKNAAGDVALGAWDSL